MDKYAFLSVKNLCTSREFQASCFYAERNTVWFVNKQDVTIGKAKYVDILLPLYTQWKSVSGSHVSVYGIATQVDVPASWWGPSTQRPIHFGKSLSQSENHLTVCLAKGNTYFNLVIKFCSTSLLYATDKELFWLAFSEF